MIAIVVAITGLLGTAIAAYFNFLASTRPTEIAISATQTAEAKQTAIAEVFAITPVINLPDLTPSSTVEANMDFQLTETPSNYADPTQFVRDYFDLLNQRRYEEAWSRILHNLHGCLTRTRLSAGGNNKASGG